VSEPVVTVFRLLGRREPKNPGQGHGQTRFDLLIQPLMVREGSDASDKRLSEGLAESPSALRAGPGKTDTRLHSGEAGT